MAPNGTRRDEVPSGGGALLLVNETGAGGGTPEAPVAEKHVEKSESGAVDLETVQVTTEKLTETIPSKVFRIRNSALTDLVKIKDFQSLLNAVVAVIVVLIVYDMLAWDENGIFYPGIQASLKFMGDPIRTWTLVLAMHTASICMFPLLKLWAMGSSRLSKGFKTVWDAVALVGAMAFAVSFMGIPAVEVVRRPVPWGSGIVLFIEQVRLLMKMYAFVRCSVLQVLEGQRNVEMKLLDVVSAVPLKKAGGDIVADPEVSEGPEIPSFRSYLYYLFAPTLVFREEYPRTKKIRWTNVAWSIMFILVVSVLNMSIHVKFFYPKLLKFGSPDTVFNIRDLAISSFNLMVHGNLAHLWICVVLLHAWQNMFGELMRFGDRMFMRDWWNLTSIDHYFKNWNMLVQQWLYSYVYLDARDSALGARWSWYPSLLVFLLSAFFHDWIACLALNMFTPIFTIVFGIAAFGISSVSSRSQKYSAFKNFYLWLLFVMGMGFLLLMLALENFAVKNCPPEILRDLNFFTSKTFACGKFELSWS